jgi:hypothetical protein
MLIWFFLIATICVVEIGWNFSGPTFNGEPALLRLAIVGWFGALGLYSATYIVRSAWKGES